MALLVCALASHPFAETGIIDDWSFIRTAQLLAQTGHVVYNGWGAMMIGWQLLPAALFIKLFGFSFTAARMSVLLVALTTAFLVQRTFVRAGVGEWNATLATLTFVLSPLFLPLSVCFMTDVPGTFAIVVCLYGCLRALQASTTGASAAWISFAALANAVGGTARQIAWLGVLVMVPMHSVVDAPAKAGRDSRNDFSRRGHRDRCRFATMVFPAATYQPRAFHIPLVQPGASAVVRPVSPANSGCFIPCTPSVACVHSGASAKRPPGDCNCSRAAAGVRREGCAALLLPCADPVVDTAFFHHWRKRHLSCRNMGVCASIWRAARVVEPARRYRHDNFCARRPNLGGLGDWLWKSQTTLRPQAGCLSWRSLLIVLLPFLSAYLFLLMPRATSTGLYDRYLLPMVFVVLLLVVRYYQENVQPRLPFACLALVALAAAVSVAGTHDLFAMFRGTLAAAEEVHASGVPEGAIDAGWEYDGLTEIRLRPAS